MRLQRVIFYLSFSWEGKGMYTVLLVDSDSQSNQNIACLLERYEFKAITLKDEADLAVLQDQERFSFVFLDCKIRITELVFLQIRELKSLGIPVIALLYDQEDWNFFLNHDFDDYLMKPVDKDSLYCLLSGYHYIEESFTNAGDELYDDDVCEQIAGSIEKEELLRVMEELAYSLENHQLEQAEFLLYELAQRRYCDEGVMECLHILEDFFLTGQEETLLLKELYQLMDQLLERP